VALVDQEATRVTQVVLVALETPAPTVMAALAVTEVRQVTPEVLVMQVPVAAVAVAALEEILCVADVAEQADQFLVEALTVMAVVLALLRPVTLEALVP